MAIKDDINVIKQELNAQEQFLENAIRTERFFKKYRTPFIIIALAVLAFVGYSYTSKYMHDKKIAEANKAYISISENPNDTQAASTLEANAPSLLAIVKFKEYSKNGDTAAITALANSGVDPLLAQFFLASIGEGDGTLLAGYNEVIKGFELLKSGKIKQANEEFSKVPADSALSNLIKNLKHYQDIK